jgi:hypothetical protein
LGAVAVCAAAFAGCDIRDEVPRSLEPQPLLGAGIVAGLRGPPAIEYVGGYEAGRQRAESDGRPLLLVCTAKWCRFSADMTQQTLRDPGLVALSRRAVCVLIDADRDAATCRTLGVKGFPTLLVLDPDGTERFRATGRASPDTLAAALATAFEPRRVATVPADVAPL